MKQKQLPDPLSERWQRLLEGLAAECQLIRESKQGREQRRRHLCQIGQVCDQISRQALRAYQEMEASRESGDRCQIIATVSGPHGEPIDVTRLGGNEQKQAT